MSGTSKSGRRDHSTGKRAGRGVQNLGRNGYRGQSVLVQRLVGDEPQRIREGTVINVSGGKGEPRVLHLFLGDEMLTVTFLEQSKTLCAVSPPRLKMPRR